MRQLFVFAVVMMQCVVRGQSLTPVVTAFPTLKIPASSRGLAMGDGGIASASANQQLYYNAAKSAFTQNFHQASVSYMPWLTGVSDDTRFMNLNYLGNISNSSTIGVSVNYLSLGTMAVRDDNGATVSMFKSSEYNLMGSYALQVTDKASLGLSFHFLGQGGQVKNLYSVSGDISYYQYMELGDASKRLEWGAVVSGLGPKVSIDGGSIPLPLTIGVGVGFKSMDAGNGDSYGFSLDANRLMADDWKGVRVTAGAEYGFADQFFLRGGVSLENKYKGNRKFFSLGAGYKGLISDQSWALDVHYLVPFATLAAVSPFQNSYGFTLSLSFGNFQ